MFTLHNTRNLFTHPVHFFLISKKKKGRYLMEVVNIQGNKKNIFHIYEM